jgi:peptidylprolyl isomerase
MRFVSTLLLALAPAALSQTPPPSASSTAKKPLPHRTTTTAAATGLPANIPRLAGVAKPLYALRYIDATVGTGPLATPSLLGTTQANSKIMYYTVKYTGWLAKDGTKFDSSFDHPGQEPITFPQGIRRVIPGWDTGFDGMHLGGKRRLFIPWQLAYGESGRAPVIPAKADLIFDIELVGVSDKPPAPKEQPAPPKPQPERAPGTAAPAPAPAATGAAPGTTAKPNPPATASPATRPQTDPSTNDPAKATTPDNNPKTAPPAKPSTPPQQ